MKQLINLRLALFIAISLCFGIGFVGALKLYSLTAGIIVAITFIVLLFLFVLIFIKRIGLNRILIFSIVFILFFAVGVVLTNTKIEAYENANLNAHSYKIVARVDEVSPTEYGNKLILSDVYIEGDIKGNIDYKISLYVSGEYDFDIGDRISFFAKLKDKPLIYSGRPLGEDISNGVKYTANISANQITLIENDKNIFQAVNVFIRETLRSGLDENEFSLAYAMLLGNSDYMDEQVLSSYRSSGVAHIFAVSGLHIGFLSIALNFFLKRFRAKRWIRALIIIPTLFFYSGVCGFTASSIRAAIMAAVMLLVSIKGERYDGLTSISIAAIIILLIRPMDMFCVGFILSFAVVLGVLLLGGPISRIFKFLPQKIANTLGTVLSAQIISAPIMLMFFGQFSLVAIIANLLFIPIVSVVFVVLLFSTILGGVFGISNITLFLLNYVIKGLNFTITAVDTTALMVGGFSLFGFVVFYYLALIVASGLINLKTITKFILTIVCLTTCVTGSVICSVNYNAQTKIYVMGASKASMTLVSERDINSLIISDVENAFSLSRLENIASSKGIYQIDNLIFCSENKDYQTVITRINHVFDINRVYYYGEKDSMAEKVVLKSFPGIEMTNLLSNDTILIGNCKFKYYKNGDGCIISKEDKNYLILSKTNMKNINISTFDEEYNRVIALDNVEWLNSILSANKVISYRASGLYSDAESFGNFSFMLN